MDWWWCCRELRLCRLRGQSLGSRRGRFRSWNSALIFNTLGSRGSGREERRLLWLNSLWTCLGIPLSARCLWMCWVCLPDIASSTPSSWVHLSLGIYGLLTWIWKRVLATSSGAHTVTATKDAPRLERNRAFTLGGCFSIILNLKLSTIHAVRGL